MFVIYLTLALVGIQVAAEQECRFSGNLTNSLKCGDNVYTRSQKYLDAIKSCNPGGKGDPISSRFIRCLFAYYGLKDEKSPPEEAKNAFLDDFGAHGEQLVDLGFACYLGGKDDPPESTKIVQCLSEGYEKVCGHKTCNWLNNNIE